MGINCKFDPSESLKAVAKMKEGLEKAGLKAHLMVQPLGFHCPDGGKQGYLSLPEFPFGKSSYGQTAFENHDLVKHPCVK